MEIIMQNITSQVYKKISNNIEKVVFGKEKVIKDFLCAFLAGGHVLLEDVPGTGKTLLIRALAASINGTYKRVQFTPDLLPSDIIGINYYNQQSNEFVFRPGPIFSNFVLADEINRATPRTQSALLECMEEKTVSVDGETSVLSPVFMVMATMNPLEFQGTFPLPEAQIDRFIMKLHMGYPDEESEKRIAERTGKFNDSLNIESVVSIDDILEARKEIANVHVSPTIVDYIVKIIRATRDHEKIKLGVSTRGVVALTRVAQTLAAMNDRDYVIPDDVKSLAVPVLAHRLILQSQTSIRTSQSGEALIEYLLSKIDIPLE